MTKFWNDLDRYADRTAIIGSDGTHFSYASMLEHGDAVARAIGRRCLVFSICSNTFGSIAGYVGFLRAGIVPVLIAENIDEHLFDDLVAAYHPKYIYSPNGRALKGEKISEHGDHALYKTDLETDYKLADDLALLLTTSGSTGSPKLVRQSAKNIESNTRSIVQYLGITQDDRAITTLPMSYTFGLSIIQTHLSQGASIITTDATLLEKRFWELFKQERATTFSGVPYIFEMLKKLRFDRMELPSLRYMTQAGGKLSKELASEFSELCERRGWKLIVMYGQTEATARMSYLPWEYARSKAGSMGIAIPGGRFWISDEAGDPIEEPDITGELMYCGDNVTLGYAESRMDLDRPDDNNGTLRTGDMAKRDADGFYYIVGRKKRFLKLFGNRVNLDEVEGLLRREGYECVCAGVDDRMDVFITDASQEEAVDRFLRDRTGISYSGYKIHTIKEIPRNSSGKVLYSELETMR